MYYYFCLKFSECSEGLPVLEYVIDYNKQFNWFSSPFQRISRNIYFHFLIILELIIAIIAHSVSLDVLL
jgi:hypothetical protein